MGNNGYLSLRKLGKSVKGQNLPYPLLRGQPLKFFFVSFFFNGYTKQELHKLA